MSETSELMSDEPMDREANEFSMQLLVPSDFLRAELTKIGGIDLEDDRAIAKLARKFRVSMQVMTLRIGQELGQ